MVAGLFRFDPASADNDGGGFVAIETDVPSR